MKGFDMKVFLVALALLLSSCTGATQKQDKQPPCTGKCDSAALGAIPGPELARCWIKADDSTQDPFFQAHELWCERLDTGDYPVEFSLFSANVEYATGQFSSDVELAPGLNKVALLTNEQLPAAVHLSAAPIFSGIQGLDRETLSFSASQVTLDSATEAAALSFAIPFKLWDIQLITKVSSANLSLGYNLALAPATLGMANDSERAISLQSSTQFGSDRRLLLPVNDQLSLDGTITPANGAAQPFTLNGSGSYILDAQGLRPALEADLLRPAKGPILGGCSLQPSNKIDPATQQLGTGFDVMCRLDQVEGVSILPAKVILSNLLPETNCDLLPSRVDSAASCALNADGYAEYDTCAAGFSGPSCTQITLPIGVDQIVGEVEAGGVVDLELTTSIDRASIDEGNSMMAPDLVASGLVGLPAAFGSQSPLETRGSLAAPFPGGPTAEPLVLSLPFQIMKVQVSVEAEIFLADLDDYVLDFSQDFGGLRALELSMPALPMAQRDPTTTSSDFSYYIAVGSIDQSLSGMGTFISGSDYVEGEPLSFSQGGGYRAAACSVAGSCWEATP